MTVSVENLKGLSKRMTVTVPASEVEEKINQRLQELTKKVRIPGFRPGKVPLKVVEKQYGAAVKQEIVGDLIQKHYVDAIKSENLKPAGMPKHVEPQPLKSGEPFTFTAEFEVLPEVKLKEFSKIEIEKPKTDITDEDVQKAIDRVKQHRATWDENKDGAAVGDRVNVDYEAICDKAVVQEESGNGVTLILGDHIMHETFEEALVGLKAGDDKEVKIKFPKDALSEALKGKKVVYKIKVNKVETPTTPELDEAYIKQLGVNEGTLEALQAEIKKNLERELKHGLKRVLRKQVLDKLAAAHDFSIPESLIEEEAKGMQKQAQDYMRATQPNAKLPEFPVDMYKGEAEKRIKLGLLMSAIIEQKELKADDEKIKEQIEDMASLYDDKQQAMTYLYKNPQQLEHIRAQVLEDQIVDLVLGSAKVKEKVMPYDELVKAASH